MAGKGLAGLSSVAWAKNTRVSQPVKGNRPGPTNLLSTWNTQIFVKKQSFYSPEDHRAGSEAVRNPRLWGRVQVSMMPVGLSARMILARGVIHSALDLFRFIRLEGTENSMILTAYKVQGSIRVKNR